MAVQSDVDQGYHRLVNDGYVGCGYPLSSWQRMAFSASVLPRWLREELLPKADLVLKAPDIPGRNADNAKLPYYLNSFLSENGNKVVNANCLYCHAAEFNGKLVMGLGNTSSNFTHDLSIVPTAMRPFVWTPEEHREWENLSKRVAVVAPYMKTLTRGVNPADNLFQALFAHRDPHTLAWSDIPLMEPPEKYVLPVRVPPWWRMSKKESMFYPGVAWKEHTGVMMAASTLCVDDVAKASAIKAYFHQIEAYIKSLRAPPFPHPIDGEKRSRGETVFLEHCAQCHGKYGSNPEYPNRTVPIKVVGTDPELAIFTAQSSDRFLDWFRKSFYGSGVEVQQNLGYTAPPLDGIWIAAPYFHNGSVPTLRAVLQSSLRPKYWSRSFRSSDYDFENVGWKHQSLDHGQAEALPLTRSSIYDTTLRGYSARGHVFGDVLANDEREDLLEYLKGL
jgi:mono/diheme cytochrome c family protein